MWLMTVQHNRTRASEAKMCHFRKQKHDIMMPKATLGSNSIYWNVFKFWQATKHKKNFCGAFECHLSLQNIWLMGLNIQKAHSCFKSLVPFCLFVFCFSRSQAFLSADKAPSHLTVLWVHVDMLYKSPMTETRSNAAATSVRLNLDAVIQDFS